MSFKVFQKFSTRCKGNAWPPRTLALLLRRRCHFIFTHRALSPKLVPEPGPHTKLQSSYPHPPPARPPLNDYDPASSLSPSLLLSQFKPSLVPPHPLLLYTAVTSVVSTRAAGASAGFSALTSSTFTGYSGRSPDSLLIVKPLSASTICLAAASMSPTGLK